LTGAVAESTAETTPVQSFDAPAASVASSAPTATATVAQEANTEEEDDTLSYFAQLAKED